MAGRRNQRWLIWPVLVALGGGFLWAISSRPPLLPADPNHTFDQSEQRCLSCHTFPGAHPRPPTHPPRDDCFSCHRDVARRLHPRPGAPTAILGGWQDDPRLSGKAKRSLGATPRPEVPRAGRDAEVVP